jgi:hypothetical protein
VLLLIDNRLGAWFDTSYPYAMIVGGTLWWYALSRLLRFVVSKTIWFGVDRLFGSGGD